MADFQRSIHSYPPLFVMLGTGFCGSLTTFSTWMTDVFIAFANIDTPSLGRFSGVRHASHPLPVTPP